MSWKLKELAEYCNGEIICGSENEDIQGFSIDSRRLNKGDLFVALEGERTDGHYFIKGAFDSGASACLVQEGKYNKELLTPGNPVLEVSDTLEALKLIAKNHKEKFDVDVIGVTGSVGKTTTKEMIATILGSKFKVLKSEGNLNTEIGLPLALLDLNLSHEVVVLEMGMSARGEISELCKIANPRVAVITNIAEAHLENLKTLDNVAAAKGEILERLDDEGIAIINGDDERAKSLAKTTPAKVIRYGTGKDNEARIIKPQVNSIKTRCIIDVHGESEEMILNLPGKHNMLNALAAGVVGIEMGVTLKEVVKSLSGFYPSEMRTQIFTGKGDITVINDAYNANVKSTKAAIDVLKEVAIERSVAILGDMYELGDYTETAHLEIGEYAGKKGIDLLFVVGNKGSLIKEGALRAGINEYRCYDFDNKNDLIDYLLAYLKSGDTVLVKGSRGMELEEIVYAILDEGLGGK